MTSPRLVLIGLLAAFVVSARTHDPDTYLTTPQIIRRHGYTVQSHVILTQDGYLLTYHRITGSPRREKYSYLSGTETLQPTTPVLLQHGVLGSSIDWIYSGPEKSLAYLLADEGYDVWLGNARGSTYSRAHVSMSPSSSQFWNFSWHEMGRFDLAAGIDYIIKETGRDDVLYVGYSMGTTMFYVLTATLPEYNNRIRAMISLAPVAYMSNVKGPIRLLTPIINKYGPSVLSLLGGEFPPKNGNPLQNYLKYMCHQNAIEERMCENMFFLLSGYDFPQFNETLLPIILSHLPASTSTRTLIHYAQEVQSGKFRQYDYGSTGNEEMYGQSTPPEYDLTKISVPIELHYAQNDWLANRIDVEMLFFNLKNKIGKSMVKNPLFNHLDFLWAKDVKMLLYDHVMSRIKQLAPPSVLEKPLRKRTFSDMETFSTHKPNNLLMSKPSDDTGAVIKQKLEEFKKFALETGYTLKRQISSIAADLQRSDSPIRKKMRHYRKTTQEILSELSKQIAGKIKEYKEKREKREKDKKAEDKKEKDLQKEE